MKGIRFVVNDRGHKTAVVMDLKMYGDLWEDIHDQLLADRRRNEPRESLEDVQQRLLRKGKLKGRG